MNITFDIWKTSVAKVFSWEIWKKLIIISSIPIAINAVLFHLLGADFITKVEALSRSNDIYSVYSSFEMLDLIKIVLAILVSIEITILIIATLHITTRESFNTSKNPENSVTHNLFEKATAVFIPFHFYLARVIWYVAWPLLAAIPVVEISTAGGIPVLPIVAPIIGVLITLYRSLRSVFSVPFYFEFEGKNTEEKLSQKEIFEKSLTFTQGKAVSIFFSLVGIGAIVGIFAIIISDIVFTVFSVDPRDLESGLSTGESLLFSVPSILFEGVTTVFFYVMYKTMQKNSHTLSKNSGITIE